MLNLKSPVVLGLGLKLLLVGLTVSFITGGAMLLLLQGDTNNTEIINKHSELIQDLLNAHLGWDNLAVERFNYRVNELYISTISPDLDANKLETIKECFMALYKEYHWDLWEYNKINLNPSWEKLNSFIVTHSSHSLSYGPGYTISSAHLNMLLRIDHIIANLDLDREEQSTQCFEMS